MERAKGREIEIGTVSERKRVNVKKRERKRRKEYVHIHINKYIDIYICLKR